MIAYWKAEDLKLERRMAILLATCAAFILYVSVVYIAVQGNTTLGAVIQLYFAVIALSLFIKEARRKRQQDFIEILNDVTDTVHPNKSKRTMANVYIDGQKCLATLGYNNIIRIKGKGSE